MSYKHYQRLKRHVFLGAIFMGSIALPCLPQVSSELSNKIDLLTPIQKNQMEMELSRINEIRAARIRQVSGASIQELNTIHMESERLIKTVQERYEHIAELNQSSTKTTFATPSTKTATVQTYIHFNDKSKAPQIPKERALQAKPLVLKSVNPTKAKTK